MYKSVLFKNKQLYWIDILQNKLPTTSHVDHNHIDPTLLFQLKTFICIYTNITVILILVYMILNGK